MAATCLAAAPALGDEDGFVPMFNGRDLTGWRPINVATETFVAKDGMIIASGTPRGVLRSERTYENFVLEFDWRHLKPAGNSGVFIWCEALPAPGAPYPRSIEVDMVDPGYEKLHPDRANWRFTGQGDILPVRGASMVTVGRHAPEPRVIRSFPSEDRTKPSPAWNHYRIECDHGAVRLAVNGKMVTRGRDCVPNNGYICLQSEDGEVHFRNLRIKELPPSAAASEAPDPLAGFGNLFNGIDLEGWMTTAGTQAVWRVTDGNNGSHLSADGTRPPAGQKGDLWTKRSFKNFELYVDWRLPQKPHPVSRPSFTPDGLYVRNAKGEIVRAAIPDAGDSGIFLRGSPRYQVNIWSQPMGSGDINELHRDPALPSETRRRLLPVSRADAPPGKWNRFLITLTDDIVTVILNGVTVIDKAPLPGIPNEGPVGLQFHGSPVEFGNLFVKELP